MVSKIRINASHVRDCMKCIPKFFVDTGARGLEYEFESVKEGDVTHLRYAYIKFVYEE